MTTDSDQHDPKEVKGFIVEWSLEVRDNVVCLVWDVDNNSDREVIVITPLFVDMILIVLPLPHPCRHATWQGKS